MTHTKQWENCHVANIHTHIYHSHIDSHAHQYSDETSSEEDLRFSCVWLDAARGLAANDASKETKSEQKLSEATKWCWKSKTMMLSSFCFLLYTWTTKVPCESKRVNWSNWSFKTDQKVWQRAQRESPTVRTNSCTRTGAGAAADGSAGQREREIGQG